MNQFQDPFSQEVWAITYKDHNDKTLSDTLMRVAKDVASVENTPEKVSEWTDKFYDLLSDFKAVSGGRIMANAGTEWKKTTYMNCISGETKVHTTEGIVEARTLVGKTVKTLSKDGVYRDALWSSFGTQKLYKVTFSNDEIVYATGDHKWVTSTQNNGVRYDLDSRVSTVDLAGKHVPIQAYVVPEYDDTAFKEGFSHGMVYGDGWESANRHTTSVAQFRENTHLIVDNFENHRLAKYKGIEGAVAYAEGLPGYFKHLPSGAINISYLRGFVAGMIATDGSIDQRGHVTLFQSSLDDITELRQIFANAGVPSSSMCLYRESSPWDDTIKPLYCLRLFKSTFWNDRKLVAKNKHREYLDKSTTPKYQSTLKVISVEETTREEEVYCCSEPETHTMVIGSGILTGQCYVGPLPAQDLDSIEGIYKVLVDQANTLKSEGGWGMNFSWIRPRGSFIHGVGVDSPGSIRFMEIFDKSSEIVTAGSGKQSANKKAKGKIRKGAMMGVLDVWHPDIIEFITAKQTPGRLTKFNISVNCTEQFMDRVNAISKLYEGGKTPDEKTLSELDRWDLVFPDTAFAKYKAEWRGDLRNWVSKGYPVNVYNTISVSWLWNLIMESTYNRNEPGVLFLDRANNFAPLNYAETILATNPSMPAGTLVHTRTGIFPIEKLEGMEFEVKSMDGQWANAECFLSGENEEVLTINLGSNKNVRSTKQHRWPVYDQRMERVYKVYASELKPGDLIPLNRNERIGVYGDMSLTEEEGFFVGYLVGDGWFNVRSDNNRLSAGITFGLHERGTAERVIGIARRLLNSPELTLSERDSEIYFQFSSDYAKGLLFNRYKLTPGVKKVPDSVWQGNDDFISGFVDGLLSSDGHVSLPNASIDFVTSREELAKGFAKLMSFAGISSNIYTSVSTSSFPNGKDYGREYTRWQVRVGGGNLLNFYNVFDISHEDKKGDLDQVVTNLSGRRSQRSRFFAEVKSVESTSTEKVWDISVYHNEHVFPAEWCYTGNCGEQTLAPGGVCCLGTINLTQFINASRTGFDLEGIKKYVGYLVRFLDNVNTISDAPLEEYKYSMTEKRRIGCGVMGWGSALFMLKVKFGSDKAAQLREDLMSTYAKAAYEASIDLAEEKGMFPYCDPLKHASGVFVQSIGLSDEYLAKLKTTGIRNSSLMSQQPNGNTSILANVVSGGMEPIFMPEYVRTVIMPTVPAEIAGVTPKFSEGVFEETSFFKFAKEGDEEILRGVTEEGVVYKIDRSRGLTREVLCEDYGVRYLKTKGEWDPSADYVVTTTELTVDDHVSDLKGFARWTDSACSKTCNIPNDYPFEDFKSLYLNVYNTGVIKGFTTYRAGTMASVLAAKDESKADASDEEIILDDVKLPDSLPATLKTIRSEGRKWYLTVILNEQQTRPVALFVHTNAAEKNVTANDAVDHLLELAQSKNIPESHIDEVNKKINRDDNATKICRMISLNLRHGVLIKNIVASLDKVDCFAGSFVFHIRKYLASFIKDGETVEHESCMECGSKQVVYQEGCKICRSCGSSKCG